MLSPQKENLMAKFRNYFEGLNNSDKLNENQLELNEMYASTVGYLVTAGSIILAGGIIGRALGKFIMMIQTGKEPPSVKQEFLSLAHKTKEFLTWKFSGQKEFETRKEELMQQFDKAASKLSGAKKGAFTKFKNQLLSSAAAGDSVGAQHAFDYLKKNSQQEEEIY